MMVFLKTTTGDKVAINPTHVEYVKDATHGQVEDRYQYCEVRLASGNFFYILGSLDEVVMNVGGHV